MLDCDMKMKQDYDDAKKRRKRPTTVAGDDQEASFHFIAYVPVEGTVWKLDGLERQPQSIGKYAQSSESATSSDTRTALYDNREHWVKLVGPAIMQKMEEYADEQIQFGLFAVVEDPTSALQTLLVENVKAVQAIETRLNETHTDWKQTWLKEADSVAQETRLTGSDVAYHLTSAAIEEASLPATVVTVLEEAQPQALIRLQQEMVDRQLELRQSIRSEEESRRTDEERARARRFDYSPAIHTWLSALVTKPEFTQLCKKHQYMDDD